MSRLPPPLSSPPLLPLPLFFLHLLLFPSPSQIVRHHELFYMALTTRTMAWTATEKIGDIFLSSVSQIDPPLADQASTAKVKARGGITQ